MLRADAQSVLAEDLGDFCHRTSCLKSKITDNDEGFIDEHPGSFFQFRKRNARIDIAVVIRAAHYDMRRILRSGAEKCADPVCRRSHFLNDFLELLDHPARLDHGFLLIENLRPQIQQVTPNWIARRQRGKHSIKRVNEIVWSRAPNPVLKSLAALVAHLWFGSIRRTKPHYSFIRCIRNLHSRNISECDAANVRFSSGALAQLVRAPPCHGGGCGFEPRRLRDFCITLIRLTTIVLRLWRPLLATLYRLAQMLREVESPSLPATSQPRPRPVPKSKECRIAPI